MTFNSFILKLLQIRFMIHFEKSLIIKVYQNAEKLNGVRALARKRCKYLTHIGVIYVDKKSIVCIDFQFCLYVQTFYF